MNTDTASDEAHRQFPDQGRVPGEVLSQLRRAFVQGARWQATVGITDDMVNRVADTLIGLDHVDDWHVGYGADSRDVDDWEWRQAQEAARHVLTVITT